MPEVLNKDKFLAHMNECCVLAKDIREDLLSQGINVEDFMTSSAINFIFLSVGDLKYTKKEVVEIVEALYDSYKQFEELDNAVKTQEH